MLNRFNPGGRGREHIKELLPTAAQVRQALEVADSAAQEFGLPVSCSIPIQPCLIDSRYPCLLRRMSAPRRMPGRVKAAAQVCYGSLVAEEPFLLHSRIALEENYLEPCHP